MTNNALVSRIRNVGFRFVLGAALLTGCVTTDDEPAAEAPAPAGDVAGDVGSDVAARTLEARNKDLLHRYHVEVWDEGHLDQAWKYLGEGFTSHATVTTLPPGQYPGPDFLAQFWAGFPDLRSHEDALLGDGDLVTLRWTITGTHTGTFFGVAPTGRTIQVSGMDILRVADGKLVEHWGGVADQMDDFLAQIGALPK
ncbi:MAG TPA: ester cyclase [Kofleriaceae bacterium]|nr:ester cyclase [Kofleriaceae bacterium]